MRHYIIPIFIPHFGCPHHCVFCNQRKITGVETNVTTQGIADLLDFHLRQITRPYFIEAAFYGGSFTALPLELQRQFLEPAAARLRFRRGGAIGLDAIRLSTRPDCIFPEDLRLLQAYGVRTIELGAQSFADEVLKKSERGHQAEDILRAARQVRAYGFQLGIQLMPGLPGDTTAYRKLSLQQTLQIAPDLVRIYPTVVIRDTRLAELYEAGDYRPLSLDMAVEATALMRLAFDRAGIPVVRTGLQASEDLDAAGTVLAGPYHPAFGEMVENWIFYKQLEQLFQRLSDTAGILVVHHAAKDTSKLYGIKNVNRRKLQQEHPSWRIRFQPDWEKRNELSICQAGIWYTIGRNEVEGEKDI